MHQPELYKFYDRSEAIAFFGSEQEARILCDGQWLIWPDIAVCLTDFGDPPSKSHLDRASTFWWVADKSYNFNYDRHSTVAPAEVAGRTGRDAIKLFVRPVESVKYIFLGSLRPSFHQRAAGIGNCFGAAQFDLSPAIPSHLWQNIGGLKAGNFDHIRVDEALDRLRTQTTTQDRLRILQRLVEYWHGPIGFKDGFTEDELREFKMPESLRWWYRWAGRRSEILGGWNIFLRPKAGRDQLRIMNDKLVFYLQSNAHWATEPYGDDPPIFFQPDPSAPWEPEPHTLSEHLILACLLEGTLRHCAYGASHIQLDETSLDQITASVRPVEIPPLRWPAAGGHAHFFAKNGAFLVSANRPPSRKRITHQVWVGARTEMPLQFLKPFLDRRWADASL